MDSASAPAVVAIRRPRHWSDGGGSFIVRIDGQRVGKVKAQTVAEFPVHPGEHTVVLSMQWRRSRPARVMVVPGSRTELAVGRQLGFIRKVFVPVIIAGIATWIIMQVLRAAGWVGDTDWWAPWLWILASLFALFGGYALIAAMLVRDYWEMWTLEPVGASSPRMLAEADDIHADKGGRELLS